MRLFKRPIVVALRASYWVPMGLFVLPACDAARVVRDSVAVVAGQVLRRRR